MKPSRPDSDSHAHAALVHRAISPRSVRSVVCALLLALGLAPAWAQHDCVPYQPTDAGGSFDNTWVTPQEVDEYSFTVPDDPGGGYVTVTFRTPAPVRPWLNLKKEQNGPAISSGGTQIENPHEIVLVYEVAAGETYWLEVYEFFVAPLDQHPWAYELGWSFTSRVDCYEPNDANKAVWTDVEAAARAIPREQVIEAYAIAGYKDWFIADGIHRGDWYRFTIDSPAEISAGFLEIPDDQRLSLWLYDEDGGVPSGMLAASPSPGAEVFIGPKALPAGTYYLEALTVALGKTLVHTSRGELIPPHFDDPYRLFVTSREFDIDCGFLVVFCDDFELGDPSRWSAVASP